MKFLFRSSDALCLPQCLRVQAEGNKVKLSVDQPGFSHMGNGFIEKVLNFDAAVDWADVVVYDVQDGPLGDEADRVRKRKPTLGASALGIQLEHDRAFGMDYAKRIGIKVPEMQELAGPAAFAKAREFLRGQPRQVDWVLKTNGKKPNGVGTFVSKDGRSGAMQMLKHWEQLYKQENIRPDFVISKKIEGAEISTEAWFNGLDFILPNHTLERNKLFPGDLGEKVGCSGNVVWAIEPDAPLFRHLLEPLRVLLAGKFVGPIDCNIIIDKSDNKPMFLEWSPRFGYDAIFSLMDLMVSDFGEFLYAIAMGEHWNGRLSDEPFAGDVRVHIPPFPAKGSGEKDTECVGVPIFGIDKGQYNRHRHLVEIELDYDNELVTSGPHGFVLSTTGRGETVKDAQQAAYDELDGIYIPQMRYRNDLVDSINDMYEAVEATGWLSEQQQSQPVSLFSMMSKRRG